VVSEQRRARRVAGGDGEREGGREEVGRWASPRDGPHMSGELGERERGWQVGPAASFN
jgi:hypothetical protein